MHQRGEPVEFEFSSADASTAAPIVLRNSGGRDSRTLEADERLVIEQVSGYILQAASAEVDITAVLTADTDGDGDLDAGDLMAVFGGGALAHDFTPSGMSGTLGVMPKVLASAAGLIRITGNGYIMKG